MIRKHFRGVVRRQLVVADPGSDMFHAQIVLESDTIRKAPFPEQQVHEPLEAFLALNPIERHKALRNLLMHSYRIPEDLQFLTT